MKTLVEIRDVLLDYATTENQACKIMKLDKNELLEIAFANIETGLIDSEEFSDDALRMIDSKE
jgi:hypothetical protein